MINNIPEENNIHQEQSSTQNNSKQRVGIALVVTIIIVSVLAGSVAGFFSGLVASRFARSSAAASLLGSMGTVSTASQPQSATSGAIVDVVKKDSPAVVSIVISQQDVAVNQPDANSNNSQNNPFPSWIDPFFNSGSGNPGNNSGSNGNSGNSTGSSSGNPSGNSSQYQDVAAGSGFFVTSDGLILTNKHVVSEVSNAKFTVTTSDGKTYDATVVATDPINDIALVKINITGAPTLQLSNSSQIQIGQQVIAIGNSLGQYQNTVTSGIVSGIERNVVAGSDEGSSEELDGVIQTDAAINPGNSGGPLLNIAGQVIGVNTAIDQQGQLVGFAIPSNLIAQDIASYQKNSKIVKPFLGISYVEIDQDVQQQYNLSVSSGAYIVASDGGTAVVSGSAADKAGLKSGDIIIAVNSASVNVTNTLAELLQQYNPGDTITLTVIRGGKTMQVKAILGTK
jgi:serine protease Do